EKSRYQPLTTATLPGRLGSIDVLNEILGPTNNWQVREVGDGNLNLIFIVESSSGSLVVKQALPYARVVGNSWPMSPERTFFGFNALTRLSARDILGTTHAAELETISDGRERAARNGPGSGGATHHVPDHRRRQSPSRGHR